ncbi:hypothetical protein [Glaciecola sp. 1036]|uniref:hypothetical protein n=1 Tax=Alteromonadaceae TaxID=72275 RepID=UPI003D06E919
MTIFSKIKTTIFALGLLAISTASNSALITYSTDVNLGTGMRSTIDYSGVRDNREIVTRNFSLANFDTSLGTLNSVRIQLQNIQITGNHYAGFIDTSDGNVSGYAEFIASLDFTVNNGSGISFSSSPVNNGRTSCLERSVFANSQECDVSNDISLNYSALGNNSASYASLFTTPGFTNYSVTGNFNHRVAETDDDGVVDYFGLSASMSAIASVTYYYTAQANPPTSNNVNTPALSGLFGLMMFSIFYIGRRKN